MVAHGELLWPDRLPGFLAEADRLSGLLATGQVPAAQVAATHRLIFNNRLDAAVTALFGALVLVILFDSVREWLAILSRRKIPVLRESEYVVSALGAD